MYQFGNKLIASNLDPKALITELLNIFLIPASSLCQNCLINGVTILKWRECDVVYNSNLMRQTQHEEVHTFQRPITDDLCGYERLAGILCFQKITAQKRQWSYLEMCAPFVVCIEAAAVRRNMTVRHARRMNYINKLTMACGSDYCNTGGKIMQKWCL